MQILYKVPGYILVCFGGFCLSWGGFIIRSFEQASVWQILFLRSFFFLLGLIVFLLIVYKKNTITKIKTSGLPALLGGFVLSFSFIAFVVAMSNTTVANVVFIISTQTMFLALFGFFYLKEKVSLIPIGLENLRRLKHGRRKWFSDPKKEKTKFILSSFNEFTNYKKRGEINSTFRDNNLIDVKKYEKVEDYFSNLQDYRFIICPEGNGLDTHRIWEGILLNTFPILKFSNFTQILQNEGIPAIYIEKWEEINDFNEKDLNKIYQDLLKINTKEYILFNYWRDRINNIRNNY